MPSSNPEGKDIIKKWFDARNDIKTIVDLGPGEGTYPTLLGMSHYVWKGVEIWGPYVKKYALDEVYDEIRIGDIRYMEFPEGDCCIAGDVLEHLPKEDMIKTFKRIDAQFPHVVLSIPVNHECKDVVDGNWFEKHLSIWSLEDLNALIPQTYTVREYIWPLSIYIK
jgi:hypothetical protein